MAIKRKVILHRETTIIEYSEDEVAELILKSLGLDNGEVSFDVSSGGYFRGVTVTSITETMEN
jgi:hypothetical protein